MTIPKNKKKKSMKGQYGCGVFLLLFCFCFMGFGGWSIWRSYQVQFFEETEGRVLEASVYESHDSEGSTYRPDITFEYSIPGNPDRIYTGKNYTIVRVSSSHKWAKRIVSRFKVGSTCTVYYDPDDPETAVLSRRKNWFSVLFMMFPMIFVAIGCLLFSPDADATMWSRFGGDVFPVWLQEFSGDIRLPNRSAAEARTLGWKMFAFIYNAAISFVMVLHVIPEYAYTPWWVYLFVLPFVLFGLWLVFRVWRGPLARLKLGPALVNASNIQPIAGTSVRVIYRQKVEADCQLKSVKITFICEERATYSQGSSSVTVKHRPVEDMRVIHEGGAVRAGELLQCDQSFDMPAQAMHCFRGEHNVVDWWLEVEAVIDRWPDYKAEFPLYPAPVKAVEPQMNADNRR